LGVATWTEIPERRADGPGSEVMVLQRGAARCEVERDVDVGEPEDSTAVVGEDEVEISGCYAMRFAVAGDSILRDFAPGPDSARRRDMGAIVRRVPRRFPH
jgi:hypothetical protein